MEDKELVTRERGSVSFFWPVIFIGVGVIALLVNAGRLQLDNLWGLVNLWPLLLVLTGIDLIFGKRLPALGGALALALIGGVVWLLLQGRVPPLTKGWINLGELNIQTSSAEVLRDRYVEATNGAESLLVDLDLSSFDTSLRPLAAGGDTLFDATIDHVGPLRYEVSGQAQRRIALGSEGTFLSLGAYPRGAQHWDIALAPDIPLDAKVDAGSGDATMDLAQLDLTRLAIRGGSGDVDVLLPAAGYELDYEGGSGDLSLDVAANSDATVTLDGGSGNIQVVARDGASLALTVGNGGSGDIRILAPRNVGLRVQVRNAGSGEVELPVELAPDRRHAKEGVWESAGYANAAQTVDVIANNLGSGKLVITSR